MSWRILCGRVCDYAGVRIIYFSGRYIIKRKQEQKTNMKRNYLQIFCFLFFLAVVAGQLTEVIRQKAAARVLICAEEEAEQFRAMQLSSRSIEKIAELSSGTTMPIGEILTVLYPYTNGNFLQIPSWADTKACVKKKYQMIKENRESFERISASYGAIWNDLEYFPVAAQEISYENSWMFERNYGGLRGHEGTDLMPPENLPGHYAIVSMTDGVVENIGWLPKGGYRIGIRSPSGGYFYYAHLDSYARAFQVGEAIEAGEFLGLMGDTGYGEEGTRGKFDVHLHLGIYIRTEQSEELSVNPYWVLRFLKKFQD